jgi:prolyl oligopeptidase
MVRLGIGGQLLLLAVGCVPAHPRLSAKANPLVSSTPLQPSAKPAPERAGPPRAALRPVVDLYHGVAVSDPYRWLENGQDPEVQQWSDAQNALTRAALDALPERAALGARVRELLTTASAAYFSLHHAGGRLFSLEKRPPSQQPFLVTMPSTDDPSGERIVVDPNRLDASGKTSIDFYLPSPDGKKVAVSLSVAGSEEGAVHIYDVETGADSGETIPRVNGGTAGGSVAWSSGGQQLFYTRYPHPGERPAADLAFYQQVWSHQLGTSPAQDHYSLGEQLPRIAEVELEASADGELLLARVAHGDGGRYEHFLRMPSGEWRRFAELSDEIGSAHFGRDGNLYVLSRLRAPRGKLLRVSPRRPSLEQAVTVVPESDAVIQSFLVTQARLYVADLVGGPSRLRMFDTLGKALGEVPTLPISTVGELEWLGGDDILFETESYLTAPAFYRYEAKANTVRKTALFQRSPADFSDAQVRRDTCRSRDGTSVPLTLIEPQSSADVGPRPTLLTAYGGYAISLTPRFRAINRLWLDQGGVVAVANLRGGGEYGEAWHRAGNLTNKQNVFDDFAACMARLVETRVTRPELLAITGGSNGGLLMGATLVQHPTAFRAVASRVGIYDMLRVETTPNGVFNVEEYGSVKDPQQFAALYAYSPYHHVVDGTAYPATLLLTGKNDPRVDPYHSRKMLARLQAASAGHQPILLRTSDATGHGHSSPLSAEVDEATDMYAFLLHELGVRFHARSAVQHAK